MKIKIIVSSVLLMLSGSAFSNCENIIALSKVVQTTVSDKDTLEQHASSFCNEYKSSSSKSANSNFGASYKFLSASMGRANASYDEVASRYCSASNSSIMNKEAYKQYIEAISPDSYNAYQQCLKSNNEITFNLDPHAISSTEFLLDVSFKPKTVKGRTAFIMYHASEGINCNWVGSDKPNQLEMIAGSTDSLSCKRKNYSNKGFVKVYRKDGADNGELVTVPWSAYDINGNKIDTIAQIMTKNYELENKIQDIYSRLNRIKVEEGSINIGSNKGRSLLDGSKCPNNSDAIRGMTSGRVDFKNAFDSIPKVTGSISSFDIGDIANHRLRFEIKEIDNKGFTYNFYTWCNTKIYTATVNYIAISN